MDESVVCWRVEEAVCALCGRTQGRPHMERTHELREGMTAAMVRAKIKAQPAAAAAITEGVPE